MEPGGGAQKDGGSPKSPKQPALQKKTTLAQIGLDRILANGTDGASGVVPTNGDESGTLGGKGTTTVELMSKNQSIRKRKTFSTAEQEAAAKAGAAAANTGPPLE